MLVACYRFRFLSRDQIMRLFGFGSVSGANARLRKLRDGKYLEQRVVPVALASAQSVYSLGARGVEAVSDYLGIDIGEIGQHIRRNMRLGEFSLLHLVECNDVRIAFVQSQEVELVRWLHEPQISLNGKGKLGPDAFFQVVYDEKLFSFFMEYDRGTMSVGRFVNEKVGAYLNMIRSGIHKQAFGINYFAVLTVVSSNRRLISLHKAVSRRIKGLFWFVEREHAISENITKPIFVKSGGNIRKSLFVGGNGNEIL